MIADPKITPCWVGWALSNRENSVDRYPDDDDDIINVEVYFLADLDN